MKVSVNRESDIPLHDQLVTQIALLIAAGALLPGQRLPSVRDLANRVDVHRNTASAVYKTLETYGVVTVKLGSGVRVSQRDATTPSPVPGASDGWQEGVALRHMAAKFLAEARDAGHADGAIAEALDLALHPRPIERIVLVDPHRDFHPIYRHELSRHFAFPLAITTLEALATAGPAGWHGAALLTSMYHLAPLQAIVGADRRIIVFEVNTGEHVLAALRALPAGQTVGLVSVSETLVRMAKEVIAGLRGEELLVLEAPLEDEERLRAIGRLSDALLADSVSVETLGRFTRKPVLEFAVIPPASIRSLAQQLPAEAFREGLAALGGPLPAERRP